MESRDRRVLGWALGVGILAALLVVGTDLQSLGSSLPGYYNDDAAHGIYLHHQFHDALLAGRLDLFDPTQFFPTGYHPARTNGGNSLEMVISGLSRLVLPWPSWLSVATLAWIPLNVLAFMPLGLRLWGNPRTAALVGGAWAVLPPVVGQMAAGRLTQVALMGLPLAVAGLLATAERGRRRDIALAAVGWALTGLGYWFNALFLAILVPGFVWLGGPKRGWARVMKDVGQAGSWAVVLVSPFLLIIFWPLVSGGWMPSTPVEASALSPVFSDALQLAGEQTWVNRGWFSWVLLPGLLWTAFRGKRRWLWLALAVVPVVFALGPAQELGERVWRLPYYPLWQWFPGLSRMMHPERWLLIGGLFGVIAAADAAVRWRSWTAGVLFVGVIGQQWLVGTLPMGTWQPEMPDHWAHVADSPHSGAVIVVPIGRSQNTSAYQPFHGRPLLGGMLEDQIWMMPPEQAAFVASSPFLRGLQRLSVGQMTSLVLHPDDATRLQQAGFSMVVFDVDAWRRIRGGQRLDPTVVITDALGAPVFRSATGSIWMLHVP